MIVNSINKELKKLPKTKEKTVTTRNSQLSRMLQRTYGLTLQMYRRLLRSQNYACAICGKKVTDKKIKNFHLKMELCVDHDHSSGLVRGLLCGNCNSGLGMFKDSQQSLNNAVNYLTNTPMTLFLQNNLVGRRKLKKLLKSPTVQKAVSEESAEALEFVNQVKISTKKPKKQPTTKKPLEIKVIKKSSLTAEDFFK